MTFGELIKFYLQPILRSQFAGGNISTEFSVISIYGTTFVRNWCRWCSGKTFMSLWHLFTAKFVRILMKIPSKIIQIVYKTFGGKRWLILSFINFTHLPMLNGKLFLVMNNLLILMSLSGCDDICKVDLIDLKKSSVHPQKYGQILNHPTVLFGWIILF